MDRIARDVLGAALLALPALISLRDFTVDDALVIARVAHHLATGLGYRFNNDGPPVDAVTPLGYPFLLAPFAASGPLAGLEAAKWLGALCYLGAVAILVERVRDVGRRRARWLPLLVCSVSAPLAAWAASGLETGFVVLLCSLATRTGPRAPWFAGVAAALRPELVPFAVVLALVRAFRRADDAGRAMVAVACALAPPLVVALVRLAVFGRAAPLSVLAKPSDLEHGVVYALGAVVGTGALPLMFPGPTWRALERDGVALGLAVVAHVLAVSAAGGDWMALYRLFVPVLPAVVVVSAMLAERAPAWATGARVAVALALGVLLFATTGRRALHVGSHRSALIESARAPLAGARRIAALDVGWVGAATSASITDLAGITDYDVAALSGGHTSKRVPRALFTSRHVDTLVLLLAPGARVATPWYESHFERAVEARVGRLLAAEPFAVRAVLPLGGTTQAYVVLRLPDGESL